LFGSVGVLRALVQKRTRPTGRLAPYGTVDWCVLARSTWTSACPVKATDLRYGTVSFRGFDGRAHTGELFLNAW
jgi:hypothetical protein